MPFRLQLGDPAPVQQSPTTCGSACLTLARMLANPPFADWVRLGDTPASPTHSPDERFAACEQVVARRTNGLVGAGWTLQLPWPRALGTPPWGARHELEAGASQPGTYYAVRWTRLGGIRQLGRAHDALRQRVGEGRPALLYVGNAWLPRHVVLVLPAPEGLHAYEPATGRIVDLPRDAFVTKRLGLAGWDVPWCVVWPGAVR